MRRTNCSGSSSFVVTAREHLRLRLPTRTLRLSGCRLSKRYTKILTTLIEYLSILSEYMIIVKPVNA